jgi:hypothetical protein
MGRPVRDDGAVVHHEGDFRRVGGQRRPSLEGAGASEVDVGWFVTLGTFHPRIDPSSAHGPVHLAEKLERLMTIVPRLERSKT